MDFVLVLLILVVVVGLAGMAVVFIVKNLLYVCPPNRVLIFSGRRRVVSGRTFGYRAIKGGRAYRIPLLETVGEMDISNMNIEVVVTNAYSTGGIPLTVNGVANVKIASHEPLLGNAIQRFLGMDRRRIERIAKETLEGNLRGVLSQLTPEQVNEDKLAFAEKLLEEAEQDLGKLGLSLDTLKIQSVSDDMGYLDSIGRKKSAELMRSSMIAEVEAKALAVVRNAENRQRARIAELDANINIVKAETERRIADALTRRDAKIAEEVGQVQAMVASAEAELKAQTARVEQVKRQLLADVLEPARAEMEAAQARARGQAQKIIEDAKATASVMEQIILAWKKGGPNAKDIFLMQKLEKMLSSLVGTIQGIHVGRLTMLPSGADSTSTRAVRLVEELKGALGVDLPAAFDRLTATEEPTPGSAPKPA